MGSAEPQRLSVIKEVMDTKGKRETQEKQGTNICRDKIHFFKIPVRKRGGRGHPRRKQMHKAACFVPPSKIME